MFWALGMTICFALSSITVYLYFLKKGQFEESEEVKYQLFHDDE